jgi:hypothetical protein
LTKLARLVATVKSGISDDWKNQHVVFFKGENVDFIAGWRMGFARKGVSPAHQTVEAGKAED